MLIERRSTLGQSAVLEHILSWHRTTKRLFVAALDAGMGVFSMWVAFTLRLDEERHLRLRLASALQRRSSQRLVTEALDALLSSLHGLDEMVAKAGRNPGNGHA